MHKPRSAIVLLVLAIFVITACDNGATPTPTPTVAPPTATPSLAPSTATTEPSPIPPTATTQATIPPAATVTTSTARTIPGCGDDRISSSPRSGLSDELFPDLGNAGYDAQHYSLNLNVDVVSNTITGVATIDALALKELASFNLDFRGLSITKLLVEGQDASYERGDHELTITPAQTVKSGARFSMEVSYDGIPSEANRNGSPTEGWTNYKDGIYVAGEPDGASTFYPVNEHPCDKATYTLDITVPKPYVVAATGKLTGTKDLGEHTTYTWDSAEPVASYLMGLNIAKFDLVTAQSPGGVPIRNYFPKDISPSTKKVFDQTPEMVQFLSDTFGPYPFEEYGVVIADTDLTFALETQTLSLFGTNVGKDGNPADETALHELSHQWFGDSVSLKQWRDIWLNEGFASYAQWLWLEHTQGRQALDDRVRAMYRVVNEANGIPPGNPSADSLFNLGVYLRGGLTLHALRLEVGDDTFFRILKTYAARFRHSNADTHDFIEVAQEVSGKNLQALFDGWLYAPQMPDMPQLDLYGPAGAPTPTATP